MSLWWTLYEFESNIAPADTSLNTVYNQYYISAVTES